MIPYYSEDGIAIYHGDCRDILVDIDARAELVIADPPYSLSVSQNHTNKPGRGTRRLDFFQGDQDWDRMTADVVSRTALACVVSEARSAYVWCGHRQFGPFVSWFETQDWNTRPIAWKKSCPVPAPPGVGWDSALELGIYAFRSGRKWTPPTGTKVPNFIEADSYRHGQPGKVDHPTQKPLALLSLPIQYSTEPGDLVLDPFMGSGTALVAVKKLGRRAIGIEIEEKYCEIAATRLAQGVLAFGD